MVLPNRPAPLPDAVASVVAVQKPIEKSGITNGLLTPDGQLPFEYTGNHAIREAAKLIRTLTHSLMPDAAMLGLDIAYGQNLARTKIQPDLTQESTPSDRYIILTARGNFKIGVRWPDWKGTELSGDANDVEIVENFPTLIDAALKSRALYETVRQLKSPAEVARMLNILANSANIVTEAQLFAAKTLERADKNPMEPNSAEFEKVDESMLEKLQKTFEIYQLRHDFVAEAGQVAASGDEEKIKAYIKMLVDMASVDDLINKPGSPRLHSRPLIEFGVDKGPRVYDRIQEPDARGVINITANGELVGYGYDEFPLAEGTLLKKGYDLPRRITGSLIYGIYTNYLPQLPWFEEQPN